MNTITVYVNCHMLNVSNRRIRFQKTFFCKTHRNIVPKVPIKNVRTNRFIDTSNDLQMHIYNSVVSKKKHINSKLFFLTFT